MSVSSVDEIDVAPDKRRSWPRYWLSCCLCQTAKHYQSVSTPFHELHSEPSNRGTSDTNPQAESALRASARDDDRLHSRTRAQPNSRALR